jgi:hypothetical protein
MTWTENFFRADWFLSRAGELHSRSTPLTRSGKSVTRLLGRLSPAERSPNLKERAAKQRNAMAAESHLEMTDIEFDARSRAIGVKRWTPPDDGDSGALLKIECGFRSILRCLREINDWMVERVEFEL